MTTLRVGLIGTALATLLVSGARAQPTPEPSAPLPLEAEISDVTKLGPAGPRRLVTGGWGRRGFQVIDVDDGGLKATINGAALSNVEIDPAGRAFYVAETVWSRGNRGQRQDILAIYDSRTLELSAEIDLPGRLLAGPKPELFRVSADGNLGFVYDMEPAASVRVVDLGRRRLLSTVETPGCGMVYPWGNTGFASLCGDGALLSVSLDARGRPTTGRSRAFFDAELDPLFEAAAFDRATAKGYFLSYSGMVYPVELGPTPGVGEGWSLQQAAGLSPANVNDPGQVTWRPGGARVVALHRPSGLLYVLMHEGRRWSQLENGPEIWVVDPGQRKVLRRLRVPTSARSVAVSQDLAPQLYAVSAEGKLWVMHPESGALLKLIEGAQYMTVATFGQ